MKMWLLISIAACAMTAQAQQQTGSPAGIPVPAVPDAAQSAVDPGVTPGPRVFRVHVVDGRTGQAVAGARVQLWYDEPAGTGYAVSTSGQGDALMPKPVGEPLRVLVAPRGYVDCRRPDRDAPPEGYNLEQIASKGMAAQNSCGRVSLHTQPGELVLYVRPSRWYEGLNKNPS